MIFIPVHDLNPRKRRKQTGFTSSQQSSSSQVKNDKASLKETETCTRTKLQELNKSGSIEGVKGNNQDRKSVV